MSLILSDEQKKIYILLDQLDEDDIRDFCKESIRVLKSGLSNDISLKFLTKCNLEKNQVEAILEHLMLIFTFLTRFKIKENDFEKIISEQLDNKLTNKVKTVMLTFYELHQIEIESIINEQTYLNTNIVPQFQDFNWRLQAEIFNRSTTKNKDENDLSVIMKFKLRKHTNEFDFLKLICDLNQLTLFQKTLDQAIKDVKLKKTYINSAFD